MTDLKTFTRPVLQKLYRYGCVLCRDQDQAYDLLQYAMEKYLQEKKSKNHNHAVAYVRAIMRNRFIDEYRRSIRFQEESYDDASTLAINETPLEDIVVAQVDLEIIWQRLDPFEREIMYYWAIEEMTANEISLETGTPRGTILSRIHRMRKKIEAELKSEKNSRGHQP